MKLNRLSIVCGLLLAGIGTGAVAESPFSANVAMTTDYVWRGVSQTDNGPAIQGGFDFAAESGFYAGIWGSNVEFGDDANAEIDLYGGYSTEFASGVGLDLGVIHYDYPSESGLDFQELYLGLGYGPVSAMISHDFDNSNTYLDLGLSYDLEAGFGVGIHAGYYDFDDGSEYIDWKLGVTKSLAGIDFELAYTDTDIDDADLADGRVIFTISKSM